MKLIYLLILIIAMCVVMAFIYFRLEKTRKDLDILKTKVENKMIKDKKKSINSETEKESLSLTSMSSQKKEKPKKNDSNNNSKKEELKNDKMSGLFGSLNIPNLFQMFSPTNFKDFVNSENMIIHPKIPNLETTSDIESLRTSQIESLSDRSINIDGTKLVIPIQSNSLDDKLSDKVELNESKICINQTIDDTTEFIGKDEDHIEVYSNSDKSIVEEGNEKINDIENVNTENVNTDKDITSIEINGTIEKSNNTLDKNEFSKKELENMKVNELKNLAKKKNINLFIGKKPKNKLELISDITKIYSIINI